MGPVQWGNRQRGRRAPTAEDITALAGIHPRVYLKMSTGGGHIIKQIVIELYQGVGSAPTFLQQCLNGQYTYSQLQHHQQPPQRHRPEGQWMGGNDVLGFSIFRSATDDYAWCLHDGRMFFGKVVEDNSNFLGDTAHVYQVIGSGRA